MSVAHVPLIGQQALQMVPCPAGGRDQPHIRPRDGESGQFDICRFCHGYGMVLIHPQKLKILEINPEESERTASAAAN